MSEGCENILLVVYNGQKGKRKITQISGILFGATFKWRYNVNDLSHRTLGPHGYVCSFKVWLAYPTCNYICMYAESFVYFS